MSRWIAVAVTLMGAAAWAQAEGAQFELSVGGKSYEVTEGQPLTVTTPGGERLELRLARKAEQAWSGDGLQFRYPREMQLSREAGEGAVTLTLESTNSVIAMLQLLPEGVPHAAVKAELEASIVREYTSRGGKLKKKKGVAVARKVASQQVKGLRHDIDMAGEAIQVEIFSLVHKGRVLGVILSHLDQDRAVAQKWFETILGSMQ